MKQEHEAYLRRWIASEGSAFTRQTKCYVQEALDELDALKREHEEVLRREQRREVARDGAYKAMCELEKEVERLRRDDPSLRSMVAYLEAIARNAECEAEQARDHAAEATETAVQITGAVQAFKAILGPATRDTSTAAALRDRADPEPARAQGVDGAGP